MTHAFFRPRMAARISWVFSFRPCVKMGMCLRGWLNGEKARGGACWAGFRPERPVSLSSGNACADALERLRATQVTRVDVSAATWASVSGENSSRTSRSTRSTARSARTGPSRASSNIYGIPYTRIRACLLRRSGDEQGAGKARRQGGGRARSPKRRWWTASAMHRPGTR